MYKLFPNISTIRTLLFTNTTARQTILKNTFWLGVGTGINKLLALGLVIYAARILEPEGYGQFTFALAFASLLMIFSDLGLSSIVTREFAREKERKDELYSLISLKIVLAFATFLFILAASFFTVQTRDIQAVILLLAFFLLANSLIGVFYSFFHARQKMEYEAWFEALQVAMIFGFGLFVLSNFPSAKNLSYVYFFSAIVVLVLVFLFFHVKVFPLKLKWDFLVWKKYLKMSWPLALVSLFGILYSYTDSVMLGYWNMFAEAGWYNAAYKIVMASLVPVGFIGASFYPALSKFSKESKEKLQKAWDYELEIMIALAVPLVAGGMILASKIIYSFYPLEFGPSILAFQILISTAGLVFLHRPLYDALIVLDQEKKTFWIIMMGAALNVVLNAILIPRYTLYGAAIATVCTHALVLLAMMVFVKRFTFLQFPVLRIGLTLWASSLGVFLMYEVLRYLSWYPLNIFFLVAVGGATYFLVFFLLRKYVLLRYLKQTYA